MNSKTIIWVSLFAVSMGYFEAAVVVYLREIVYPGGFAFPLQPIEQSLATTEIYRELFSLLMLLSVGIIAGKRNIERFAWFMLSFAIWDVFYYLFLKLLTGWPESFMTMDILFLLPVTWVGPVIAPCILSLMMAMLALLILHFSSSYQKVNLNARELLLLIFGSVVVIVSFTLDYVRFVLNHYSPAEIWSLPSKDLFDLAQKYYPEHFSWLLFGAGALLILTGIILFTNRNFTEKKKLH